MATREETLEQALRDVLAVCKDRAAFVAQGPRAFARAEQIAHRALGSASADPLDALLAEMREKIAQPDACEKGPGAALARATALADDAGRSRTTHPHLARGEALDAMAWLAIGILALDREAGR